jgi:hypothetical protein
VGRQRNAGDGRSSHGHKFLIGFSLVAWKRERLNPIKNLGPWLLLPSPIFSAFPHFFVEETYNITIRILLFAYI